MEFLSGEQILAAEDLRIEEVECPNLGKGGGKVRVKAMSLTEQDAYQKSLVTIKGGKVTQNLDDGSAKLLARTICDEQGRRLFNDAQIEALGRKTALALEPVIMKARELNNLTRGQVEDAKKNSETTGDSSSSTSSPDT